MALIEALQKFFPWASELPPAAKLLLSALIVGAAALALLLIWSPPSDGQRRPDSVPTIPEASLWPANQTLKGLTDRLDRISRTDRQFIRLLANAGRDGVYVDGVNRSLGISRAETLSRAERLSKLQLIETLELTDKNFRLSERLKDFVRSTRPDVLDALLK